MSFAFFSKRRPEEIIEFCLISHFNSSNNKGDEFSITKLRNFFQVYSEYFDKQTVQFLLDECVYLGNKITLIGFIYTITSGRRLECS